MSKKFQLPKREIVRVPKLVSDLGINNSEQLVELLIDSINNAFLDNKISPAGLKNGRSDYKLHNDDYRKSLAKKSEYRDCCQVQNLLGVDTYIKASRILEVILEECAKRKNKYRAKNNLPTLANADANVAQIPTGFIPSYEASVADVVALMEAGLDTDSHMLIMHGKRYYFEKTSDKLKLVTDSTYTAAYVKYSKLSINTARVSEGAK